MKFLVGYLNNASGKDALKPGINLAQMLQGELVVCQILPKRGKKSSKIDDDCYDFLYDQAQKSFETIKPEVPPHLDIQYVIRTTDSASGGLLQTAAGFDAENIVINEWREQIEATYHQVMQSWYSPVPISLEIGDGDNWKKSIQSIDWHPNEMLVIGFNKGEVLKHFLSSKNVEKILRYAFVPRLVLPRVIS